MAQSSFAVAGPYDLIGELALLLVVSHFSESHFQVYGWGFGYVSK
jgi:hypothetical protein